MGGGEEGEGGGGGWGRVRREGGGVRREGAVLCCIILYCTVLISQVLRTEGAQGLLYMEATVLPVLQRCKQ